LVDPKEIHDLGDSGVDRRTLFRGVLKKYEERVWIGFIWLRIWTTVGLL
jgi:hypothetical protein